MLIIKICVFNIIVIPCFIFFIKYLLIFAPLLVSSILARSVSMVIIFSVSCLAPKEGLFQRFCCLFLLNRRFYRGTIFLLNRGWLSFLFWLRLRSRRIEIEPHHKNKSDEYKRRCCLFVHFIPLFFLPDQSRLC